jgi:hypothetical protein
MEASRAPYDPARTRNLALLGLVGECAVTESHRRSPITAGKVTDASHPQLAILIN